MACDHDPCSTCQECKQSHNDEKDEESSSPTKKLKLIDDPTHPRLVWNLDEDTVIDVNAAKVDQLNYEGIQAEVKELAEVCHCCICKKLIFQIPYCILVTNGCTSCKDTNDKLYCLDCLIKSRFGFHDKDYRWKLGLSIEKYGELNIEHTLLLKSQITMNGCAFCKQSLPLVKSKESLGMLTEEQEKKIKRFIFLCDTKFLTNGTSTSRQRLFDPGFGLKCEDCIFLRCGYYWRTEHRSLEDLLIPKMCLKFHCPFHNCNRRLNYYELKKHYDQVHRIKTCNVITFNEITDQNHTEPVEEEEEEEAKSPEF